MKYFKEKHVPIKKSSDKIKIDFSLKTKLKNIYLR